VENIQLSTRDVRADFLKGTRKPLVNVFKF